jgi:hypothetical protein
MRVVWNITENSNIDGIVPQVGLMRRFHELINLENATTDIYMALSKREKLGNDGRALLEEIDKASEIINHPDQDWEGTFSIAENHTFLRGMVGFFFTPNITTQQFIHRYENVKKLFETEAIAEPFRQDAILNKGKFITVIGIMEKSVKGKNIQIHKDTDRFWFGPLQSPKRKGTTTKDCYEYNKELFYSLEEQAKLIEL